MKNKIPVSVIFVLLSICGIAQTPPPPPPPPSLYSTPTTKVATDTSDVQTFAEVMPQFNGGTSFMEYLSSNIKYPVLEKEGGKQGTVYISFIVEKDGSVTNVHPVKEVSGAPGLTKEAMRVMSAMPNWKPGTMNGVPVRIEITQPIKFMLTDGNQVKPSFIGGDTAFANYISQNLKYPAKENKAGKEGTVWVTFYVETDGSITHIIINSTVPDAPGFTKEAKRLIKEMPDWKPGTIDGKASRMQVVKRIVFTLNRNN